MGIQRGGVHISGKIGDVQYYLDRSQGFVRMANPPSKEKILTDEAYAQTRKSMAEFKGSAKATTTLIACFGGNWKSFGERFLRARLQKLMRDVVKRGTGLKGKRRFEVAPNLGLFRKFELSSEDKFGQRFKAPYTVTVNTDRNTAVLDVGAFHTHYQLEVPQSNAASHFRVFVSIGVLTDFIHVGGQEEYASTQEDLAGMNAIAYSASMVCDGTMNSGFQVMASLPSLPVLPSDACLVVCLGVEFLEIVSGVQEFFAQGNAMQIHGAY
jgi:hypothetical protein